MTASTASAKSHRSADTTEKFSDRSCNDRPIPPSTRIIDPVSRKVHVRFLAAAGRKVFGPQMFRKHGKYTRPLCFSKRHFRVRILHAQPASPVSTVICGRALEIPAVTRHSREMVRSPRPGSGTESVVPSTYLLGLFLVSRFPGCWGYNQFQTSPPSTTVGTQGILT